jgi:transcriptional regulator with XRE-family HTH domain
MTGVFDDAQMRSPDASSNFQRLQHSHRQARAKARLSQTEVARALDVHRSAVSQWEAASGSIPTVENLMGLANITGTNFEWLALGRGRMHPEESAEEAHAIHPDCIAQDWHEERLLQNFRRLAPVSKKALVDFLHEIGRRG